LESRDYQVINPDEKEEKNGNQDNQDSQAQSQPALEDEPKQTEDNSPQIIGSSLAEET